MTQPNSSTGQFAVYYIPEVNDREYQVGSSIVGYDVRNGVPLQPPDFIKDEWRKVASQFGFHVTLTDAIDIQAGDIKKVENALAVVLSHLVSGKQYVMRRDVLKLWRGGALVRELFPNDAVISLHASLTASLHPIGNGSAYTREGLQVDSEAGQAKMRRYHAPYIFDNYKPHFTYLSYFDGTDSECEDLTQKIEAMYGSALPNEIQFNRLTLVFRKDLEQPFNVYKEFTI